MTEYIFRTSLEEADYIVSGDKSFIFRDMKYKLGKGDQLTFQPYKNGKMTRHPIEKLKFRVTYVSKEEPIEKGFIAIGFRRIA